jgi:hypothetical protein
MGMLDYSSTKKLAERNPGIITTEGRRAVRTWYHPAVQISCRSERNQIDQTKKRLSLLKQEITRGAGESSLGAARTAFASTAGSSGRRSVTPSF